MLVLGLGWLTSSLRVFIKDIGQIIGVILQLGFWVTPIFWQINTVPNKYLYLIYINPVVYLVEGYRNSLINEVWFWESYRFTPYFLVITTCIFIGGAIVFKRLKPHFGDVL
jgi:lipopolysaccharide transport system permease protein/teichoic acid transport system permease protein